MSLTIKIQKVMPSTYTIFPPFTTNYIHIDKYKNKYKKYELICNCTKRNIIFNLFFCKNKVNYTSARLYQKNQKRIENIIYSVIFYSAGNLMYKELILNYECIRFSYISYIPIDKFLYNIYSLYKYLLLLCYNNKTYPYRHTNLISKKKFNCMRNYKNILYLII